MITPKPATENAKVLYAHFMEIGRVDKAEDLKKRWTQLKVKTDGKKPSRRFKKTMDTTQGEN